MSRGAGRPTTEEQDRTRPRPEAGRHAAASSRRVARYSGPRWRALRVSWLAGSRARSSPPSLEASGPDLPATTTPAAAYPFFGAHQGGVSTPLQGHLHFAAFDVAGTHPATSSACCAIGRPPRRASPRAADPPGGGPAAAPTRRAATRARPGPAGQRPDRDDRLRAVALRARRRRPIRARRPRPAELEPLPSFDGDALEPAWSDGDLGVQVCADDPQVAVHAIRNLARIAGGRAAIRWSQMGFSRVPHEHRRTRDAAQPVGFKDGTNNILGANEAVVEQHVWLPSTSVPAWLAGGTYLVVRRSRSGSMRGINSPWTSSRARRPDEGIGGPLSGGDEFTARISRHASAARTRSIARPMCDWRIRRATHIRILRRGYNYVDGTDAEGRLDAGLLFMSYQRSPDQFSTIQRALGRVRLNPFIRHVGSAIFAIPPGPSEGGFVGETLLG